ncbi:DUF6660 family protein [Haliscomenobacter hydrossis]|uniref:DUF6660 family protein n=1 Tax=Haliscomenobacter hydrossis TaxID=2350 RepID=UPI0009006C7B
MKIISCILAIYIVLLSINPCCSESNCTGGDHYTNQEHTTGHHHQDKDCTDNCSPFFTCGTCLGFILPATTFLLLTEQAVTLTQSDFIYNPFFISEFNHSIWQPPTIS